MYLIIVVTELSQLQAVWVQAKKFRSRTITATIKLIMTGCDCRNSFVDIHDNQLLSLNKNKDSVPEVQHYLILLKLQLIVCQLNAEVKK